MRVITLSAWVSGSRVALATSARIMTCDLTRTVVAPSFIPSMPTLVVVVVVKVCFCRLRPRATSF